MLQQFLLRWRGTTRPIRQHTRLALLGWLLAGCAAAAPATHPPQAGKHSPASCGAELAEDAQVPERLALLMRHVANNLDAHARWVGRDTPEAEAERDALARLAIHYRRIASSAKLAASTMRNMRALEPAPHDAKRWDRVAFERWMRTKVALQRSFAGLLLQHAETSEKVLSRESATASER